MKLDFAKGNGLVPAIIQHAYTSQILMLGYMDHEAVGKTLTEGKVTFYSRSRQRLWTKGETSGNYLRVVDILPDCDRDTLLIKAIPTGPVCHTGNATCFADDHETGFLYQLEAVVTDRMKNPQEGSYTSTLFAAGLNRIAQKVGEEATELIIEAKDDHQEQFIGEAADLFYHLLVLLQQKGCTLFDVEEELRKRHQPD